MPVRTYRIGLVAALLVLIYGAVHSLSVAPPLLPSFRIATTEPGVYRVSDV